MRWCRKVDQARGRSCNWRCRHLGRTSTIDHLPSAVLKFVQRLPAVLINQGLPVSNSRHHLISGIVHHSERAHLCLRLGAGSELCRPLHRERKLLHPIVGSFLHLYGEPVERFRRARRVQQTKGLTLTGREIYVTTIEP